MTTAKSKYDSTVELERGVVHATAPWYRPTILTRNWAGAARSSRRSTSSTITSATRL